MIVYNFIRVRAKRRKKMLGPQCKFFTNVQAMRSPIVKPLYVSNPFSRLCLPISISSRSALNSHPTSFHPCYSEGLCSLARQLFDELPQRDIPSLNSLLISFVRGYRHSDAWSLFCRMHRSSALTAHTLTAALAACSALPTSGYGQQVHGLIIKSDTYSGIITKTAILDMYSKCGLLDDSVKVFEEMEVRDVVAWNALLSSFLREGLAEEALNVFEEMKREKVVFSEFTLCSVLKACAALKDFRLGKQVHGVVVVMDRDILVLGTALVDFYSSVGCISEAMKVYTSLNCRKDDIMLNSLISGCVKNKKYEEAFSLMSKMRPNAIALTSALAACSENSDLWRGRQIHCVLVRHGFASNTLLCNILLDMYAKCGKILNAQTVFDGMCHKDVVSWSSMIQAYGSHGDGLKAFELFKMMVEGRTGVLPNSVTFLSVLSACGHSGLVQQGQESFYLAKEKFSSYLGPEHYACIIDILGRAGKIDEVWSTFNDMEMCGVKITSKVWAAVLNACSHNQDVSRGEFAAKKLLQMDSKKAGNYVLASNFYASIGKWDSVDEMRRIMRAKGLTKEAGNSLVTSCF
ncbi:pentatricopeptide repeat-containing protein At5g66500, mitochondrial [Benincasa hispida]|uniref:pentatricopeptide repeat-containing protein At5g66500, mitochondrial n=1 Tax=Benincasa hispida TaxID=102211 RepID=UPI00190242F3|nr:pentatricopeptide repeat-containing protein At5g66500, mitochondrial [Benincasa hispida]